MNYSTPEDCVEKLSKSFSSFEELKKTIDETTIAHKFKATKINGDKKYFYFQCHKSGVARSIEESIKIRDKNSIKTGSLFYWQFLTKS